MDSDPASVGTHCSVPSCNTLDFLPIRCRCDRNFCTIHAPADVHQCTFVWHSAPDPESSIKRERCAAPSCNKPTLGSSGPHGGELSSGASNSCRLSFCVDHRHPDTHSCSALAAPQKLAQEKEVSIHVKHHTSASAANARLPPSVTRSSSKLSSDPKKAAMIRKVALMKLRHRAVPADPKDSASTVPLDQRLHVTLKYEPIESSTQGSKADKIVWFRKASEPQ
ncbi:hypothetical protein CONPUDRAFT_49136 [Coniophora puteana RWD-64-598 SS2]|uniref:AN1-type domain-containing protein n=1 Tax=Coniophora puteana (strain RWD-64-598) TaxID=741705 RepID=A0A5M3N1N3_CONPW|nr:uncharacterized protein CONPUDRAFT_49136 [Coniophora puteana RWD-64-598 SS2]EIW85288.1 hypothetical protein CONPUDRAFT_49136 [Coniophora puteana RWD-64-598 SS2]